MFDDHENFALADIITAPSPATTGTSLTVGTGLGALFPTPPFNATVFPANALPISTNAEIVRVTNIVGDVFTIDREEEGTTAKTILSSGWRIVASITKKTITDIESIVSTHDSEITTLQSDVANAESDISTLQTDVSSLDARIDTLEATTTKTVMFDTRADGAGGAVEGNNEGSPEVAFTGTPTSYWRGRLIVPNDYAGGNAVIRIVMRSTNTGTHTHNHFIGCRSSADGTAWSSWNLQNNVSTTSQSYTANTIENFALYTIPDANIDAGSFVTFAFRITTAITGTIYGLAAYLEYTAEK